MKKIAKIILAIAMVPSLCFAECDFSLGIKPLQDGTFAYSQECHRRVGVMDKQIDNLNKAVELKDLALKTSNERTQLWMDTTFRMEERVQKMNSYKSTNQWIYFGLGIVTMFAATYAAGQIKDK